MTGESQKGGNGWESILEAEGSTHKSSDNQHCLGTCITKHISISTRDVPQALGTLRGCLVKTKLQEKKELGQQSADFGGHL